MTATLPLIFCLFYSLTLIIKYLFCIFIYFKGVISCYRMLSVTIQQLFIFQFYSSFDGLWLKSRIAEQSYRCLYFSLVLDLLSTPNVRLILKFKNSSRTYVLKSLLLIVLSKSGILCMMVCFKSSRNSLFFLIIK